MYSVEAGNSMWITLAGRNGHALGVARVLRAAVRGWKMGEGGGKLDPE